MNIEYRIIEEEDGKFYPEHRTVLWWFFRSMWGCWWKGPHSRVYFTTLQDAADFIQQQKEKSSFVPRVISYPITNMNPAGKQSGTPCSMFEAKIHIWPDGDWVCDTCGAFSASPKCRHPDYRGSAGYRLLDAGTEM